MHLLRILIFVAALALPAWGQAIDTSKLTGTVYDVEGAVIVKAKVTAIARDGKRFEAVTNDDGVYVLTLPYKKHDGNGSKYDLVVDGRDRGFQLSETKGYVFIPSQFGKMTLDIALVGIRNDIDHP